MINHMRTLLLNRQPGPYETQTALWPSDYTPVILPGWLREVRDTLIPRDLAYADEQNCVDTLMVLLHTPELEPYCLRFDNRITYLAANPVRLLDLCLTQPSQYAVSFNTMLSRVTNLAARSAAVEGLFRATSRPDDIADFKLMWHAGQEGVLRLGAVLLAYLYQVENLR